MVRLTSLNGRAVTIGLSVKGQNRPLSKKRFLQAMLSVVTICTFAVISFAYDVGDFREHNTDNSATHEAQKKNPKTRVETDFGAVKWVKSWVKEKHELEVFDDTPAIGVEQRKKLGQATGSQHW